MCAMDEKHLSDKLLLARTWRDAIGSATRASRERDAYATECGGLRRELDSVRAELADARAKLAGVRGELASAREQLKQWRALARKHEADAHCLRRRMAESFEQRVTNEVGRAIELTGLPDNIPERLYPLLADVQRRVASVAMQRRKQQMKDFMDGHGLHPSVDTYGSTATPLKGKENDCPV